MPRVPEGELLWQPSADGVAAARITDYQRWLSGRGVRAEGYGALWSWSVDRLEDFWASIWDYFGVLAHRGYDQVLPDRAMPGARWFPGATLNFAEHALARTGTDPAVLFRREDGRAEQLTFDELRAQVAAARAGLRRLGVGAGDRVAALLPNGPPALTCFLAAASLGAVWSSCSPDFGARSVADRFTQIEPTVLVTVDGYRYNGRTVDVAERVRDLQRALPGLSATVLVRYAGDGQVPGAIDWAEFTSSTEPLEFEPVPFDHPLWILYSSGTTGLPKPIVHGHGGILLEHLKALALHHDLGRTSRLFWFTTTGWMMWNFLVGGLLVGSSIVLYDGSPTWPAPDALWRLAADTGVTCFGTSAPYLQACARQGLEPGREHDLSRVTSVGSTGAPLSPEGFAWVYEHVGRDLLLASVSGGTDVCTAFVGANPVLPVHAGEIQCRLLGANVAAFDEAGRPVVDQVGELVVTEPMPSMPVKFWNDPDGHRLAESYFAVFPGVWRHGDWVRITARGSCVIYGRSDSTLNRGGVRMGTSEFYRVVEELPDVADSLVVDTAGADGTGTLLLFVVPTDGAHVDEERIRREIRAQLSPRHVPDRVVTVPEIPRTLNGKKCEVPVKRILGGTPPEQAVAAGALANPASLAPFVDLLPG
jgi:acetoacetyl-CoA synthetase